MATLAIMLFFALVAVLQYYVVRHETEDAIDRSLEKDGEELNRDVAYDGGVDPARYNNSSTSVDRYMALLNDGTVLSYATGNDPIPPGLLPTVELTAHASAALDGPVQIDSRYDSRSKSETWWLLGKRLDRGYAIVGLSEHDNVSADERNAMLRSNLDRLGHTLDEARSAPVRQFDNQISWAVVDGAGNLCSGTGRIPLRANALRAGLDANGERVRRLGEGTYFVKYSTITEASRRPIGMGVLFSDARYDYVALANLARFDLMVGALCAATALVVFARYRRRHESEKHELRKAFENYFSPQVLETILREPGKLKLGGQRREVTILFSDIRSFTALSERLPPQQLTQMLQEYFEAMGEAVAATDGVLDKYIGDAIMAFWGAPIDQPDQADRAVATAIEMTARLDLLKKKWSAEGLPEIEIGIGVALGVATVGNFGSSNRFDYTVIGDVVNTASRLEALNKNYGSRIIISSAVRSQLTRPIAVRDLGEVEIRGKAEKVRALEVALEGQQRAAVQEPSAESAA
jgi:class 3 adenylate cyclase